MSAQFVALLRGINVGTAKRVPMADLRSLVEELGYSEVRTLLNSGNVVFTAAKAEPRQAALRIQKALEEKLGVSARVMVVSAEELTRVVAANPLTRIADNPSRLMVGILAEAADREKLADIAGKDWGNERIAWAAAPVARAAGAKAAGAKAEGAKGTSDKGKGARSDGGAARAFYMWIPDGVIESKLNAAVSKVLRDGVTARNWSTMLKLKEMTEEGGG
jgi:uncharacterized protein (DUF1697 family)